MKNIFLIFLAVMLIMTALLPQSVSATGWVQSESIVIGESNSTSVFLAAKDPDELPVIPAPGKQEKKRGDADGNGIINYMDALLVLRHSVGLEHLGEAVVVLCDVDSSGGLTYMDALLILRYSVGLITSL